MKKTPSFFLLLISVFISFSLLLPASSLFAQQVTNVRFEQEGKMINVYYDLTSSANESFEVNLYLSTNGGSNWAGPLVWVSGAVGEKQRAGTNQKIIWDVLKEREKLAGNILFEVRAYAGGKGTFTDSRDGKQYKYVKIGTQVWMAENLNYRTSSGSWAYDNKESNAAMYGRLYNWETAKNVCPTGWHLPSDKEWKTLEMYLGMSRADADVIGSRDKYVGGKLKETGTTHWRSPNKGATNASGFSGFPAGYRNSGGAFNTVGKSGSFWSSTEESEDNAWRRYLYYDDSGVSRSSSSKASGSSVRCLRD